MSLGFRQTLFLAHILFFALCLCIASAMAQPANAAAGQSSPVDPYAASSELIHHMAGYALIASALLIIASQTSPRLHFLQTVWPFLFLAGGLFLAGWSDGEIWPRGEMGWGWMLRYDAEARQHKIFALLLILMSLVEYLRWRQKLTRFWATWAFPLLATAGAVLLLFHAHGGGMQAQAPAAHGMDMHAMADMPGMQGMKDMKMDASAQPMAMDSDMGHMDHVMTPVMLRIKREHLWFTIVGLGVALFKFAADSRLGRYRWLTYLWPSAMGVLGILLAVYRE